MDELDAAFASVMADPHFSRLSRAELLRCEVFCQAVREAPHATLLSLQGPLERIALATDDHNEATGLLGFLAQVGGGLVGIDHRDDIPVSDAAAFTDWAIAVPAAERDDVTQEVWDALLRARARIAPGDRAAELALHQAMTVAHYALEPVEDVIAPDARESFHTSFPVREQIPARLWEALLSRPADEVGRLRESWWGPDAAQPNDLFIALEWQREGRISITRTPGYLEAVADFLLDQCAPDPDQGRPSHGAEAVALDPFLAADLYEALSHPGPYRWLLGSGVAESAEYLGSLFAVGALDPAAILAALDHGIGKTWDKAALDHYRELRERLGSR